MDSKLKEVMAAGVAALLSAAALYRGGGLYPVWWLMWLAPLPVLWVALRVRWHMAAAAAVLAWTGGGLNVWDYYRDLHLPLILRLSAVLLPAIVFGAAVLLFRFFALRERTWLAVISLPCVWIAYEYLLQLSQGTYGNLAYTQMDCLPVLQLASVTGMWGIGFLVLLFPSFLAAFARRPERPLAIAVLALFGAVFAFGFWRLRDHPANRSIVVGMAASDLPQNRLPEKSADALRLLREYASQANALAQRGARIILFPEMSAVVLDASLPEVDRIFGSAAQAAHAQILLPIVHPTPKGTYNEARLYAASGALEATYCKHHLVPIFEDRTTPCSSVTVLQQPEGVLGIEICKDMDYLKLARTYGRRGVGLLLVPAWDFVRDGWLHGRMAIMRGIENGFTIARVAKNGILTISDTTGRVTAEQNSSAAPFATLIAVAGTEHVATSYASWGDWFAWLNCALLLFLLVRLATWKLRAKSFESNDQRSGFGREPLHRIQ